MKSLYYFLTVSLFIATNCQTTDKGLTYWNRVARVIDNYIIEPLSGDGKKIQRWWQRSLGFTDEERKEWLLQFEVKQYAGSHLKDVYKSDAVMDFVTSLLQYVKDPVLYAQMHAELYTYYALYGKSAEQMSCFVRALMHEVQQVNSAFRIFELPCSALWSMLMQETSREGVIKRFNAHAPCIIFLKDSDYLGEVAVLNYESFLEVTSLLNNLSVSFTCPVILLSATHKLVAIDTSVLSSIDQLQQEGKWHTKSIWFS